MTDFEQFWRAYPRVTVSNPCSVDGCENASKTKGLCNGHYHRLLRYGSAQGGNGRQIGEIIRWLQDAWRTDTDDCQISPFPDDGSGYCIFAFQGKYYRAHRFVCEMTFGPAPSPKHDAAHECGNAGCVNKRHIVWKTHKDNIDDKLRHGTALLGEKHHQAKLTKEDVLAIRAARGLATRISLAEKHNIGRSTVDCILDGRTWRHV